MHTQVGRGKMTLLGFALKKKTSAKEKKKDTTDEPFVTHLNCCMWVMAPRGSFHLF